MTRNMQRFVKQLRAKKRRADIKRVTSLIQLEVFRMFSHFIGQHMPPLDLVKLYKKPRVHIATVGGIDHDKTFLASAIAMTMGKKNEQIHHL